jgi:hypothetical protein
MLPLFHTRNWLKPMKVLTSNSKGVSSLSSSSGSEGGGGSGVGGGEEEERPSSPLQTSRGWKSMPKGAPVREPLYKRIIGSARRLNHGTPLPLLLLLFSCSRLDVMKWNNWGGGEGQLVMIVESKALFITRSSMIGVV